MDQIFFVVVDFFFVFLGLLICLNVSLILMLGVILILFVD